MNNYKTKKTGKNIAWLIILFTLLSFRIHVPVIGKTLIFPVPQQLKTTADSFILDENTLVIVPGEANKEDLFLARYLVNVLSEKYNLALKIEERPDIPDNKKAIIMGKFNNPLIKKYCKQHKIEISEKNPGPEGYLLQVNNKRIIIAGSDDSGSFYGMQSLRQLIDHGNGKIIQGLEVKDWPKFSFRGIRLYVPGPENILFFKKFLRDFMSLYKFNKVIIEFTSMRLDRHPELNAGLIEWSKYMQYSRSNAILSKIGAYKNSSHYDCGDGFILEKSEVRDIVTCANENFIEVIPELPSLTHSYYLLTRHPELAEFVGDVWPSTYCPSNPDTYKLLFDVFDEYIEVINPKMINIGHDEWWGAPLDVCPLCKGKDFSTLFARDINKIYDYLKNKGILTAMWGDFLLESVRGKGPVNRTSTTGIKYQTPGGTRPEIVRDSIPKDILIINWIWDDPEKEMEFHKFGFKQIYGNFSPGIKNLDDRAGKFDLLGGAPSSWASTNEFNICKDHLRNFLGCANILWSEHTLNRKDLATVTIELMPNIRSNLSSSLYLKSNFHNCRVPSKDGDTIEPVNISKSFNFSRSSDAFNINLSSLLAGEISIDSKIFSLADKTGISDKVAIAVGTIGKDPNILPSQVKGMSVNEDVSSLIFLHACALPSANKEAYYNLPNFFDTADLLGWYEIVYDDEFREIIPIQYGVNILEWNLDFENRKVYGGQNVYCYLADPVNCSSSSDEKPIIFYAYEWVNKRFGKSIKEVNLYGTVNYQTSKSYGQPFTEPMKSNAILLAGISKVKKRMRLIKDGSEEDDL